MKSVKFGRFAKFSEPIFPNNQCMILYIHEWAKDPFKVQDRLMNFNITKHESSMIWF